ncbi:CU044_2847 family protein [Streptomyces sp. RFCAC02]|uniref:CU044_2847 family protein n=1 Tax=Streptomyces sp. RFCAC02 TaxID=2499143 RepID=UPI001020C09B|nr:CU044_2847 family protein [Streptomyces sp. RFCAC02]
MHVIEVPVGDDGPQQVLVQVKELDEGLVRVGRTGGRTAARAVQSFDAMLGSIRPVAERFVTHFRSLPQPPDEICVEFGVSLSADAEMVIASASAEANFSVSLTWHRPEPPQEQAVPGA